MKHEKVRGILDKKMSELNKLSGKVAVNFDADVIHDLRVTVKSLRAMMRMLAAANGERFKLPKKFRHLYHIAGDIREAQLELGKIKEAQLELPQYEKHIREIIKNGKGEWKKLDVGEAMAKLERRISNVNYGKLRASTIAHFLNGNLASIHALCMSPAITDEMMHSIRKQLKDVMYVMKSVRKDDEGIIADMAIAPEQLEYNSQLLGDYNDARIMLGRLVAFVPLCNDPVERQAITDIYEQGKANLQAERSKIVDGLLVLTHPTIKSVSQTGTELQGSNQVR